MSHGRTLNGILKRAALLTGGMVLALPALLWPATAADCGREQVTSAVNAAGEKLRQMTVTTQPVLQTKMLKLKEAKGWSQADYEEKGYALLEDDRTAKLDASANELLERLDRLGADTPNAPQDCARIADIEAASLELQATVRAKSQYILTRLDQLVGEGKSGAGAVAAVPPTVAPKPSTAAPAPATKADPKWSTQTKASPPVAPGQPQALPPPASMAVATPLPDAPPAPAPAAPPPSAATDGDGYAIDEIVAASQGVFGKVSANLARVLEHAFAKSGRPTGYILGQETGGAFIAGLRYGSGTLYLRTGGTLPVYWHGPSLGADVGAQGAATLFLVYKVRETNDVFSSFTGVEGSAFVVGGIGVTYMSNGRIDMAPIRSGLGLRVGANFGYVRFTSKPTWNPF